jgi:transcriptional antiterminator RfaH
MEHNSFNWYAVYTRSNFEKRIRNWLSATSIEAYLPLKTELRQWSDRKKSVEEPLIKSYVFVKIAPKDYLSVLSTPGVVKFISFAEKPVVIPEYQISIIRRLLADGDDLEISAEVFEPGDPIEVISGKLMGLTGELIEVKGRKKVVIRIDQLERSLLVNISSKYLRRKLIVGVN